MQHLIVALWEIIFTLKAIKNIENILKKFQL